VRVHRRRRCESDGVGDLTDARRIAALLDGREDEIEDLLLARAERVDPCG
jgi:hypothetical protein